jgi:hypothetical protein
MKNTIIIIAAAILNATFFTGCKKEDSAAGMATSASQVSATTGNKVAMNKQKTFVTYQLQINRSSQLSPFQWQKGTANVSEIHFLIAKIPTVPEEIPAQDYFKVVNVQMPIFDKTFFGGVNVQTGIYKSIALQVILLPQNGPSLALSGIYKLNGRAIDVNLLIEDNVTLQSTVTHEAYDIHITGARIAAALTANIDGIMAGVNPALLTGLNMDGNTLTISKQTTPQLYAAVLESVRALPLSVVFTPMPRDTYIEVAAEN